MGEAPGLGLARVVLSVPPGVRRCPALTDRAGLPTPLPRKETSLEYQQFLGIRIYLLGSLMARREETPAACV